MASEAKGPFKAIKAVDRRSNTNAAFVNVVVEDANGDLFYYETAAFSFDLKPYTQKD